MTEDDAKTKWCPAVRWTKGVFSGDVYTAHNRYVDEKAEEQHGYNRCVASGCMMWRKYIKDSDGELHGYCGLAGKP